MFKLIESTDTFILISKNTGVSFHKADNPEGLTERMRKDLNIQEFYPVHRLDKITSGLLLFARTKDIARELASQFQAHSVEKFYLAIGGSEPKKKQGLIVGDMKKGRDGEWILAKTLENPAKTRFLSTSLIPGLRLYMLKPFTGRTHQVRVALKSIGAPVLGDPLYTKKVKEGITPDRGYLHSYAIQFTIKGVSYRYKVLPDEGAYFTGDEFKTALQKIGEDPWELKWGK